MQRRKRIEILRYAVSVLGGVAFLSSAGFSRAETLFLKNLDTKSFMFELLTQSDIDEVAFDVSGGYLDDGILIGRIIRASNLKTSIPSGAVCLSACAEAFVGGVTYEIDGILGFHIPHLPEDYEGDDEFDCGVAAGMLLTNYHREMGIEDLNSCILTETTNHVFLTFRSTEDFLNRNLSFIDYELISNERDLRE